MTQESQPGLTVYRNAVLPFTIRGTVIACIAGCISCILFSCSFVFLHPADPPPPFTAAASPLLHRQFQAQQQPPQSSLPPEVGPASAAGGQETPFSQDNRRARYGRGPSPDGNFDRDEYPHWKIDQSFQHDVFTFVRVQFDSYGRGGAFGGWSNDYPDCDLNFSFRLQELTSLQVDPNGKVLRLTDPALFDYPFVFMSNLQQIALSEPEILALRRYLLNGGFLLADDFWTPAAWRHISGVMKEVLPGREPRELDYSHPIFHLIYDLPEIPRIPSIRAWQQGHTFEYWHGDPEGDEDPHFMGYFDDAGRLIAVFCYNNDVGDGFEREGENHEYFEKYSVQVSYPLGINIVMYALTH